MKITNYPIRSSEFSECLRVRMEFGDGGVMSDSDFVEIASIGHLIQNVHC